jgi:N-acetylneuraminate synthase
MAIHNMEEFSTLLKNVESIYSTDTIFILGKGPSADLVRPEIFTSSLVIGVNDAERLAPADVTIFHAPWVERALAASGFRSRLYLAPAPFHSGGRDVLVCPFVPLTQASSDLMMQRFLSENFSIEEVLFISALQLARKVAELRGRKQTVYMVGFDFDPAAGYSKLFDNAQPEGTESLRSLRISPQEHYFVHALYVLRNSQIEVKHVGTRSFSVLTPADLNESLAGRRKAPTTAPGSHVAIVAELTTNHFGDRSRLERMIRASHAAGADYVKLQKRDVEGFYTAEQLASPYVSPFGATFGDYRRQLELDRDDFAFVGALCKELGLGWFASVLDQPSFEYMLDLAPAMMKLPSTISEHTEYLGYVANNYSGKLVLSTGMTDESYERLVLQMFSRCEQLYLLQCNSAYPTPLEDCNVAVVRHYHELSRAQPRLVPGYSSHDFGWQASALAVAAGARMLEKHVKLGNTEWAHFDAVAVDLTTPQFMDYTSQIREAEIILGSDIKKVNSSEHHKYFRKNANPPA